MKKRVVSVGLVLLLVAIGLSGCQEKTGDGQTENQFDSRFIGEWQNETFWGNETSGNETWTFYINSTVKDVKQQFGDEPFTSTSCSIAK